MITLSIKNNLEKIRLENGFKFQKDFADFLELSQYQYNRYERNERQPSLEIAIRISKKLNIDVREIFYLED